MMPPPRTNYDLNRDKILLILLNDWRVKIIWMCAEKWLKWDSSIPWNTCYERFNPDCSLLICLIIVLVGKPEQQTGTLQNFNKYLSWLQGRVFPNVPVLKKLPFQN